MEAAAALTTPLPFYERPGFPAGLKVRRCAGPRPAAQDCCVSAATLCPPPPLAPDPPRDPQVLLVESPDHLAPESQAAMLATLLEAQYAGMYRTAGPTARKPPTQRNRCQAGHCAGGCAADTAHPATRRSRRDAGKNCDASPARRSWRVRCRPHRGAHPISRPSLIRLIAAAAPVCAAQAGGRGA